MLVIAQNPSYEDAERTFVTAPSVADATSISAKNTSNFSANTYAVFGNPGQEKTEIKKITGIASIESFTTDAMDHAHSTDDPIYYSRFNQIKIYRATSSGGSYSVIATISIQIDNPRYESVYDDTSGTSSHYYKVSYYNDVTTLESSLSDPIPGSGYGRNVVGRLIDEVLDEGNDQEEQITSRGEVLTWFNDCNDYVYDKRKKWRHWRDTETFTLTADTETVSLPTDFDDLDYIEYNYVSGSTDITYRLREVSNLEMDRLNENNNASHDDKVQLFAIDYAAGSIRTYPIVDTTQTSKGTFYFYKTPSVIDSEGDEVEIPDVTVYKHYALWKLYFKKDDQRRARLYKDELDRSIINMVRRQKKQSTQARSMQFRRSGWRGNYKY